MTNVSHAAVLPGRERPWWGPIDVLLAVVFIFFVGAVGGLIGSIVAELAGYDLEVGAELPAAGLFFAVLIQQIGQGAWPWIVSRWKGEGVEKDWRFVSSLPSDLYWGMGLAFLCFFGSSLAAWGMGALVSLPDSADPSNTSIISDNQDSPWLLGVILLVVVGAPLTEELLFRGLVLRAFEKSFGAVFAVIGSTAIFTLPHIQAGATWRESTVLLAAIAMVGLVLAVGTIRTGRLGPPVIAHFLFNGTGTLLTLF